MPWLDGLLIPKVLFLVWPKANHVPPDAVLDKFDLVYKREMLQDLNGYPVSENNVSKMRTMMLSCPIVPMSRTKKRYPTAFPDPRKEAEPYEHDIFFTGALSTNPYRQVVLERLQEESFDCFVGLQASGEDSGHSTSSTITTERG